MKDNSSYKAKPPESDEPTLRHVAGPWGWYAEDHSMATLCGYDESGRLDPDGRHVLTVTICKACQVGRAHWEWGQCYTANAADAHLIAAAPILLAALQAVERHNDNPARYDSHINEIVCAAIIAAKGE